MFKKIAPIFILLVVPVWAAAQQRPLTPPDRPPVPLTDSDQERARAEELKKKGATSPAAVTATLIKVPSAGCTISSGNQVIDGMVNEAASRHGLDPCLIFSVMRAESAFNRMAISPKGASGLMQLMPATATRFGVKNIFDPRENVFGGAKYLRWLLDRFSGDVRLALAGYNAGEGAVEFYGYRIPPFLETQNYVRTIYTRYSRMRGGPALEPAQPEKQTAVEAVKEKLPTYNQIIRFTSSSGDAGKAGQ
jgi:soluble lytic murein transglycosylase-like protein